MNRRKLIASGAAALATSTLASARNYEPGAAPVRYPDPDVVVLDDRFAKYKLGNTSIQRIYHNPKTLWTEGPAWNGVGRYLLFSDIPNTVQLRWIEDDGRTTLFRHPSGNSNGNTFDFQGRQIACEHGNRKVVRYEYNGTTTVLASDWQGKPFNAPNDVIVHPEDGAIWFTDPGYGSMWHYEGNKGPLHHKEAIYRIDAKTGNITKLTDEIDKPNGLCFSNDYKKLYVSDTGQGKNIKVWNIHDQSKLGQGKEFASMKLDGFEKPGNADGIRCDTDGNVWASAGWVGQGYDGVHIFAPDGDRIGQIYLPEICSNVCFGGRKRNRLFMTASTSVYAVYVDAIGAHIT
jgi:gluconolactonase